MTARPVGFCTRCTRHYFEYRAGDQGEYRLVRVSKLVDLPYIGRGRLFGPTGRYTPKSTQPVICLCRECLNEIWPRWEEVLEKGVPV